MQLLFLLNFACTTTNPYGYSGFSVYDYLAFDGDRAWTYQSESEDYTLVVEKYPSTFIDGIETATFEYSKEDPYEALGSVTWQSGSTDGIGIESYSLGGEKIELDEFVVFAKTRMADGDTVESSANDVNFTGIFNGQENCPNDWGTETDWVCLYFSLSAEQEGHGIPFVGDYWMANGWGASRFKTNEGPWASDEEWVLIGAEWENAE